MKVFVLTENEYDYNRIVGIYSEEGIKKKIASVMPTAIKYYNDEIEQYKKQEADYDKFYDESIADYKAKIHEKETKAKQYGEQIQRESNPSKINDLKKKQKKINKEIAKISDQIMHLRKIKNQAKKNIENLMGYNDQDKLEMYLKNIRFAIEEMEVDKDENI